MKTNNLYVQYGCGLCCPSDWKNFDASPTLRIQKIPILNYFLKKKLNVIFPDNAVYGNIIKGLPIEESSCDGVFCSHTLEHLSLNDFRKSLINTYKILKPGGIFRCVVPDLEIAARNYIDQLDKGDENASMIFLNETLLGTYNRPKGIKDLLTDYLGNSNHMWMWDKYSLKREFKEAGFKEIKDCRYGDCEDSMFKAVEDESRFINAVATQCKK
jgi:predicted SAM-dependent methyltransferase